MLRFVDILYSSHYMIEFNKLFFFHLNSDDKISQLKKLKPRKILNFLTNFVGLYTSTGLRLQPENPIRFQTKLFNRIEMIWVTTRMKNLGCNPIRSQPIGWQPIKFQIELGFQPIVW